MYVSVSFPAQEESMPNMIKRHYDVLERLLKGKRDQIEKGFIITFFQ